MPPSHPDAVLRRLVPDPIQVQVILGSLLGTGVVEGRVGERRLVIADAREDYVRWKYERLLTFAVEPPAAVETRSEPTVAGPARGEPELAGPTSAAPVVIGVPATTERRLRFRTIAHPLFDELACLVARRDDPVRALRPLLGPLGLAVWMTDLGLLELREGLFLPQRAREGAGRVTGNARKPGRASGSPRAA